MRLSINKHKRLCLKSENCHYADVGFVCIEGDPMAFPVDMFVCGRADGYYNDGCPDCEDIDLIASAELFMNWRAHVRSDL